MEAATAGQQYNKRWDALRDIDPFFNSDNWKESNGGSWKAGTMASGWGDVSNGSSAMVAGSVSPSSVSNLLTRVGSDGNVDKVLYQNLVEMLPLVETFMDRQNTKSFTRHAPMVYTPTPAREPVPPKKAAGSKGPKNRGQLPKDDQPDQSSVDKAVVDQLQVQIVQLQQKLQEKENQLQVAQSTSLQNDIIQLESTIDELQKKVIMKENEVKETISLLSEKQDEVASLHSVIEKAEANAEISSMSVQKVQQELQTLQQHVATFLLQMQNMSANLDNEEAAESSEDASFSKMKDPEAEDMELVRRRYLASIIAAREKPSEELIILVAELRTQLHSLLMQSDPICNFSELV